MLDRPMTVAIPRRIAAACLKEDFLNLNMGLNLIVYGEFLLFV